jgi:LmbE family N-acetylglucosaminyl deacetylase
MTRQHRGIGELREPYTQIYLSPHLDDAALSCGGAIARFAAAGQAVLVVNICDGSPPLGGPFSAFATFQHDRWGLPAAEAVARRLAEDAAALELLGADSLGLGLLDAIYRMPEAYVDDVTLFGEPAPGDLLAAEALPALRALAAAFPDAIFYAPLAVGGHVDHRAIHTAAAQLSGAGATVAFFEDFPYAVAPGALETRITELGGPEQLAPASLDIGATLERKRAAIAAYGSQLETIFAEHGPMPQVVAAYAQLVAPPGAQAGERVWFRL